MSVASLSNSTVQVVRMGEPSGAAQTRTQTVVYSGKARVRQMTGREKEAYGRDAESVMSRAYIAGTPSIRSGDIPKVSTDEFYIRAVWDVHYLGKFVTMDMELQR